MYKILTSFILIGSLALKVACAAGPTLTSAQIQTAIQEGSKYKTIDKFFDKGLRGKRVQLASSMAVDGISKYVTFYNDWQAVAAESAAANQQMRELKPAEIESRGLLHAFVEIHARGQLPVSKLNRRYREQRAHMVLKIGDKVIQPLEKDMVKKSDQGTESLLLWPAGKITLDFAFDVLPTDLQAPVEVILIDGDGHRHQHNVDLSGVLTLD
jgi:hypothetical protein